MRVVVVDELSLYLSLSLSLSLSSLPSRLVTVKRSRVNIWTLYSTLDSGNFPAVPTCRPLLRSKPTLSKISANFQSLSDCGWLLLARNNY